MFAVERVEHVYLGLDLGQRHDYTALAALARMDIYHPEIDRVTYERRRTTEYRIRHLQRLPLGTPYPEVVERVARLVRRPDLNTRCTLVIDGTGVGVPVVDLFKRAGLACPLMPVSITPGEKESRSRDYWQVPKRNLMMRLQVTLQERELRIADGLVHGQTLVKEMLAMRSKDHGRQFGAWRAGQHDDLVLAVALAVWAADRAKPGILGVNQRLIA